MSSKIVGWLVGAWDGKFQISFLNLKEKKYSEINLKKGNPTFLPLFFAQRAQLPRPKDEALAAR